MQYDVIIIGAGLSGLSAASLLAKSGLKVAVLEQAASPGGTCGIFKRKIGNETVVFEKGAAMLYGFGKQGFNAHRFLFNCLEEPIEMVKHDLLYVVHYNGKTIRFPTDVNRFITELSDAFPSQKKNIRRFYKDMQKCYHHVISETPNYSTPDTMNPKDGLKGILRHPISYLRFLSYMNISAKKLLLKYFSDPEILHFFDKLTSTYCYATLEEAPAILASVMFIDNHEGGSYYPAGSTLFLPGKLEKVIEEHGGDMYYGCEIIEVLYDKAGGYATQGKNPDSIDESEITVYILSIDDHTLCGSDKHVVMAIGPSFRDWETNYSMQKKEETLRILSILEKRFPGFNNGLLHHELATPQTIERYTLKNGGAAAGPKQMLGQHMLLRQPIRTRFDNFYVCGESTTMGTGTPTVTTSGIAAANAILEKKGLSTYVWDPSRKNYVHLIEPPIEKNWMQNYYSKSDIDLMALADKCLFCEHPSCCSQQTLDIPGIMRRVTCGNYTGAKKIWDAYEGELDTEFITECERKCIQNMNGNKGVLIWQVLEMLHNALLNN